MSRLNIVWRLNFPIRVLSSCNQMTSSRVFLLERVDSLRDRLSMLLDRVRTLDKELDMRYDTTESIFDSFADKLTNSINQYDKDMLKLLLHRKSSPSSPKLQIIKENQERVKKLLDKVNADNELKEKIIAAGNDIQDYQQLKSTDNILLENPESFDSIAEEKANQSMTSQPNQNLGLSNPIL